MAQAWAENQTVIVLNADETFLVQALLDDARGFLKARYQEAADGILSELEALASPGQFASASESDGDTVIWGS